MPESIYLKIAKAPGSSKVQAYSGQIEVLSYRYGLTFPMTLNERSNDGEIKRQGRPNHGEFQITKLVDKASPNLYLSCSKGESVGNATLTVAGSDDSVIFTYELTEVVITSISVAGGARGDPVETVSLDYATIEWKEGASNSTKWDRKTNKTA
ncbi:Hcp family type VI secretion system effector [Hyalangium minutum]|uniref:Putative cytoplasmic protein USSDB7A n=1 Tax=Hyalangium minutum TaxID=394096 RepID=A0A085W9S4_9BACT|nr:type VI secretion system tube protein Hcp [Hyalangium minutum]KFE64437.1 putative cytoplasmic protein USSDB7A [Hyalangium minutum]